MKKGSVLIISSLILMLVLSGVLIGCSEGGAPPQEIPGDTGDGGQSADDLATQQANQEQASDAALAAFETTQAKAAEGGEETEEPVTGGMDGDAILETSCTQCHSLDPIYAASYDAEGWRVTIDRMVRKGAVISDEDAEILIEFLLAQE